MRSASWSRAVRRAALGLRAENEPRVRPVIPEDHAVSSSERSFVLQGLNTLGETDRLVLAMRYFEQLTETAERRPNGSGRSWWMSAAAAAVVVGSLAVFSPTSDAVADWLGIGSTRIEVADGEFTGTGIVESIVDGSKVVPFDEAAANALEPPFEISHIPLGPPDGVVAVPEGGELFVWTDTATTLWIRPSGTNASVNTKLLGPEPNHALCQT